MTRSIVYSSSLLTCLALTLPACNGGSSDNTGNTDSSSDDDGSSAASDSSGGDSNSGTDPGSEGDGSTATESGSDSESGTNSDTADSTGEDTSETIPDVENAAVIDDFEDGDIELAQGSKSDRKGTWRVQVDDGSKGGSVTPGADDKLEVESGGAASSEHSLRIQGKAYTEGGAGLGVHFQEESADAGKPYDASAHDGISFEAKGKGHLVVYLGSAPAVATDGGGDCTDKDSLGLCGDVHALRFELSDDWKQFQIRFDDARLHQEGWGAGSEFDPSKLIFMQFHTDTWNRTGDFDISIDNVGFFDKEGSECEIKGGDGEKADSAPYYPFPQNQAIHGTRPSKCYEHLNDDVVAVYELWKKRYLKRDTDIGTYCEHREAVYSNLPGPLAQSITTSEAHGYCMMTIALMAGYDKDAKEIFDELNKFAKDHPNGSHSELMGWRIKDSGYDDDSASDGDFDISYALLLADMQWGGYKDEAVARIGAMKAAELIDGSGRTRLGDLNQSDFTRPSDWMPDHFHAFAAVAGANEWSDAADEVYRLVKAMQSEHSSETGLLPDFAEGEPIAPAAPNSEEKGGEGPNDGNFSYNACRTPWRLVMDYGHHESSDAKEAVAKMLDWAIESTHNSPGRFLAGYKLDGSPAKTEDGEDVYYSDVPFTAPIMAAATLDKKYQLFLDLGWELVSDQIKLIPEGPDAPDYYAHSLALLSMLYASGNWWSPVAK